MILHSLILEILVALVMVTIVVSWWRLGRRQGLGTDKGWAYIEAGLILLLVGTLVDGLRPLDTLATETADLIVNRFG